MMKTRLLCGLRVALETASLVSAWRAARSLRLAGYTYLKVDGDILLACAGPVIFGFSAHSGALRWTYPTPLGPEGQLLAAHGGRVYVSGGQRPFLALDALTGHVLWRYDRGFATLALVADDQHVHTYAGARAGWVITTVRASDGSLVQTLPLQDGRETLAALTPGGADGGIAYLMRDSRLCAVRLHDGEELWRTDPFPDVSDEAIASPFSTVQVAATQQSLFYAYEHCQPGTRVMRVGALDARSGAALWRWRGPERPLPLHHGLNLTAALGNLYLSTGDGVFAFGGADGRLLWHLPPGFDPAPIAPALASVERM
jgi:outer membrane protein assembly factor BamB